MRYYDFFYEKDGEQTKIGSLMCKRPQATKFWKELRLFMAKDKTVSRVGYILSEKNISKVLHN